MKDRWEIAGPEGLAFFGRVTAATTHELKNTIGIINENAGLLEDLLLMAEQGMGGDMERLARVIVKIQDQVRRTDGILNGLSRFAHSVDRDWTQIRLGTLLEQSLSMSRSLFADFSVKAELEDANKEIIICTSPFHLLHLLGRFLAYACRCAEPGGTIYVNHEQAGPDHVSITLAGISLSGRNPFPEPVETVLMEILGAQSRLGEGMDRLVLTLPEGTP